MEMMERFRRQIRAGAGDPNQPWFKRYGKMMLIGFVALFAIIVFLAGFFAGESFRHPTPTETPLHSEDEVFHQSSNAGAESVLSASPRKGSLPLTWDGSCPRKTKCPQSYQGTPPLILVSLDGLRADYLTRSYTPTLNKLAQCGTSAQFMYPVFPSKTFPNHYSIVTGLNPASHGIVDNSIYDPVTRKLFKVGSPDMFQSFWYQKDPIWVTAEKQGKKAASFFWPGTDVKINNTLPSYNRRYSSRLSFDVRVDQVLEWLDLPVNTRPSFITLYVNQPDHAAHASGTKSQQVNQALTNVDRMIERLFSGLQKRNLIDCVNVLILSDHGMSDTDCKQVVDIQRYMDVSKVFATMGPFGRLRPKGRRDVSAINDVVSKLRCKSKNMRVYTKEQLPVRWHFADNDRIEPIFLDLDSSWTVVSKSARDGDEICSGGAHGYDNYYSDMRSIFIAHGPSIKSHLRVEPFINTELYELMTELIGVVPNPNNGTRGSLHHILKSPLTLPAQTKRGAPAEGAVPADEMDYNFRVYASNCSCAQPSKQVEPDVDAKKEMRKEHAPFGIPYDADDASTLRMLYNSDYLAAYDLKYRIPMWTSFTLLGKKEDVKLEDVCWTGDARIPHSDTSKCGEYNSAKAAKEYIQQRPLFSPGFSAAKDSASLITNSIPKSMNHSRILEKKMNQILGQWSGEEGSLNVVMGPAFDLDATGLRPSIGKIMRLHEKYGPLVVPTHIFVIATWCSGDNGKLSDCKPSNLESHSYLLPNQPYPQNCEPAANVIEKNAARVVDIEKLTGLSFFTDLPTYDAIRLRTSIPRRSVF